MSVAGENPLPSGADTLLSISGLGGFSYQARGLTQTLSVIRQAVEQERTVNGKLIDVSNPIFRQWASKITCSDVSAPPFDGLWPGAIVTVQCAAYLCYLTGNLGSPARAQVVGSVFSRNGYTFYRPILTMMVGQFQQGHPEWQAGYSWSLDLEEVSA